MALRYQHPPQRFPAEITCEEIFDGHFHGRDLRRDGDGRADIIIPRAGTVYGGWLGMGNTMTVVTTPDLAVAQRAKWHSVSPPGVTILIAGLLSKKVSPDDIIRGWDKPEGEEDWHAMKIFLKGVSNDGGNSVADLKEVLEQLHAMADVSGFKHKRRPMPCLIHLERKFVPGSEEEYFILEREWRALQEDLSVLLREVPKGSYTIEHISDHRTVEGVRRLRDSGMDIYGGISPIYSKYTLNDLFRDAAFHVDDLCWPLFKTEKDRKSIHEAMLNPGDCFYFGSDTACHFFDPTREKGVKVNSAGLVGGGQTQIPAAIVSYVIEQFALSEKLDNLNAFVSRNGRKRFGLTTPPRTFTFHNDPWEVESKITQYFTAGKVPCGTEVLHVPMGGEQRIYRRTA